MQLAATLSMHMLTELINKAASDYGVKAENITVYSVERGTIHNCQAEPSKCKRYKGSDKCWTTFDNADYVVTLQYDIEDGYRATYGVLDGNYSLWMD